jgi:hypothetical protein
MGSPFCLGRIEAQPGYLPWARSFRTDYIRDMTRRTWRKVSIVLGPILAGFLAACDPQNPKDPGLWGTCDEVPPCSAFDYRVDVSSLKTDSATGAYLVTTSDLQAHFIPDFTVRALSRRAATSTSCAPCSGEYVTLMDSAYFTTDLVTLSNDTLKAGTNLVGRTLPVGIQRNVNSVHIFYLTPPNPWVRFRDSLFEIRFSGMIDSVRKSASAKFRVADSALLLR